MRSTAILKKNARVVIDVHGLPTTCTVLRVSKGGYVRLLDENYHRPFNLPFSTILEVPDNKRVVTLNGYANRLRSKGTKILSKSLYELDREERQRARRAERQAKRAEASSKRVHSMVDRVSALSVEDAMKLIEQMKERLG